MSGWGRYRDGRAAPCAAHTCAPMPQNFARLAEAGLYDKPAYFAWELGSSAGLASSLSHVRHLLKQHAPVHLLGGICAGSTLAAVVAAQAGREGASSLCGYLNFCGGPPSRLMAPAGDKAGGGGASQALVELLCDPLLAGDPRARLAQPPVLRASAPRTLADVRAGDVFEHALVKNAAPFGLFVDVGVGTDGLLHSSQLRGRSGAAPPAVGSVLRVVAQSVDTGRGRLSLALCETRGC